MLLSTVVIILREVLEVALLMSVLMSMSSCRGINLRWSLVALLIGIIGAVIYATEFEKIAMWFDYVGQEIVNASLHIIIVMLLAAFVVLYEIQGKAYIRSITFLIALAVALSIVSEGSEILLYLSGYLNKADMLSSVILGGIIGAGIGMSIGALLYYSLTYFIGSHTKNIAYVLLALFSASMLSHAVTMLTQADWLPSFHVLWDSSSWLAEDSLMGQLLYAIIGYEATPTATQLAAYIFGIVLLLVLPKLLNNGDR